MATTSTTALSSPARLLRSSRTVRFSGTLPPGPGRYQCFVSGSRIAVTAATRTLCSLTKASTWLLRLWRLRLQVIPPALRLLIYIGSATRRYPGSILIHFASRLRRPATLLDIRHKPSCCSQRSPADNGSSHVAYNALCLTQFRGPAAWTSTSLSPVLRNYISLILCGRSSTEAFI